MVNFYPQETADKVKRSLERFCDGTTIHGCNELFHAKTMFWRVTWLIFVVGACIVTAYQIYSAIMQYMLQGSVTQVLPPEKGGLLYPTLAMCYIHFIYWVNFEKAYKMGFNRESILYAMSFTTKIFSSTEFDINKAKVDLARIMDKNNITTMTQLYIAIAHTFPMTEGGVFSVVSENPPFFTTYQLVYKDPEYYMCYTVSGKEIEHVLEQNQASISITSRVSKGLFSFAVQDPNYNLYKNYVTYEEYNYYAAYWVCGQSSYWAIFLEDYAKNYTKFTMPIKMYPDINDDQYVRLQSEDQEYTVLMKPTVQRSKSTKNNPCVVGEKAITTDDTCQKKCETTLNNQLLDCMYIDQAAVTNQDTIHNLCSQPINFLKYQRTNPNFPIYPCDNFVPYGKNDTERTNKTIIPKPKNLSERRTKLIQDQFYECRNKCDLPCEIWNYATSVSVLAGSPAVTENTFKNQTVISYYYPQQGDVLIVIDIDAQSWEDFVANVGGLLGVWTGASFITFLQLPYLCCLADREFDWKSLFQSQSKPPVSTVSSYPFNASTVSYASESPSKWVKRTQQVSNPVPLQVKPKSSVMYKE